MMDITRVEIELSTKCDWLSSNYDEQCDFMNCENKATYKSSEMAGRYVGFQCGGGSGSSYVHFCSECYETHKKYLAMNVHQADCIEYNFYDPTCVKFSGSDKINEERFNDKGFKGRYSFKNYSYRK